MTHKRQTTEPRVLLGPIAFLSLLLIASCSIGAPGGNRSPQDSRAGASQSDGAAAPAVVKLARRPVDYDNPISGVSVASVAAAGKDLPFVPVVPRNLGLPKGIFVTDSPDEQKANRAAAFVYDTGGYGRVTVTEALPSVPAAEYDADQARRVLATPPPGITVRGKAELVTIRGNVQAAVSMEDEGTLNNVHWLQAGVEVILRGPTLTRDQALEIANGL